MAVTRGYLFKYQILLLHTLDITLKVCQILISATLFLYFMSQKTDPQLTHCCVETIEQTYQSRSVLKDKPLPNLNVEWFTDGNSFVHDGVRNTGYVVVIQQEVTEAKALPPQTPAQKAELLALIRDLQLGKDLRVNVFTLQIGVPSTPCSCCYMERKGTPNSSGIPQTICKDAPKGL